MDSHPKHEIVIAGAGIIGRAAGLILREVGGLAPEIWIGDADRARAEEAAQWILAGSEKGWAVHPFHLPADGDDGAELAAALVGGEILLDCLPGSQAERMASLAAEHGLHYANLTEHVKATEAIRDRIAPDAERGFLLQTGLAPGFVNVLAHGLFQRFCEEHGVESVDALAMRVGALTANARPPCFYGFTWSTIGVATEYVEPAVAVRDHRVVKLPALSEREELIIEGVTYEADLTSGGAADLPEALAPRVRHLDYKTLRYPGHYDWVQGLLTAVPEGTEPVPHLEQAMLSEVPVIHGEDLVVVYAAVQGRDARGRLHRREVALRVPPFRCGARTLSAIQATTAAGLAESARLLLTGQHRGLCLQQDIDPGEFLTGPFVSAVYGVAWP